MIDRFTKSLHRLWHGFWTIFVLLSLFGGARIGEASKPGPVSNGPCWSLGVVNPSGLLGKSHILGTVPADVIAISETHLTKVSKASFFCSLKSTGVGFSHFVPGSPMNPRSDVSDAGQWAGVAVASKFPSRAMAVNWPPDLFETGRIAFCATYLSTFWLCGCVLYGIPPGITHPNAWERTMNMIDFAVDHLVNVAVGPRYLAGDWNFEPHQIRAWDTLKSAGWIEIQDLWEKHSGAPPCKTCKSKTRKDFLWISPELARHFVSLAFHDTFADHLVMCATFENPHTVADRWLWPKPSPIDWTLVPDLPDTVDFSQGDPSDCYHQLWKIRESQAKQTLDFRWSNNMAGRAAIRAPLHRQGWPAPLKKSRSREVQPGYHGFSILHARWFKQLRRLQSYTKWASSTNLSLDRGIHGAQLWTSILTAQGFRPSFADWWHGRAYRCPTDIADIPTYPPSSSVAQGIFEALQAEVRVLEDKLNQARRSTAQFRRASQPQTIFQDVRRPAALPVETLLEHRETSISQIDLHDQAIELDPPLTFVDELPVLVSGHPIKIHHAEPDKIWVESLPPVKPGDKVVQTKQIGSLTEVFDAFHTQWKRRWCKHDAVPLSQWRDIITFARQVMPFRPPEPFTLSPDLLKAEVHRKKKNAATGLDGASRKDFIGGGPKFLQSIVSLYDRACTDGQWPTQVLSGSVASLAKTPEAATVNQYRPITIFGFAYRCWASIHARVLLDSADTWADPGIFGNRKGYQAAHLWKELVHQIELAYSRGDALSGLTADIEKAYNCLPRWPIICAALFSGAPYAVLTGWIGAITGMKRHFKVQDSFSEGFTTSTGLAEGCALSCYGMLLLDHLFHVWLRFECPTVQSFSYVDNWDLVTHDPNSAVRQLQLVLDFASKVDLTIDKQKTYGWSTCATIRRQFRESHIPVKGAARDLGAHISYNKQYTNATVKNRLDSLDDFWISLKRSPSPYLVKIQAVRTVAWPRGLHAVSSTPIGATVWGQLRSVVTQSTLGRKAGVDPFVLLCLVEGGVDPEEVGLISSMRDVREFSPEGTMACTIAPLAHGFLDLPPNAPSAIFLNRLHKVGISVSQKGELVDRFGPFQLHDSYQEVLLRLQWACQQQAAAAVAHRSDFQGIDWINVWSTRTTLKALSPALQSLYRLNLAGGSFTADFTFHWTDSGCSECKWCGQPDSLFHRFWRCPQTEPLRQKHAPNAAKCAHTLPSALSLRGWALYPPTWPRWISYLANLPREIPKPFHAFPLLPWVDVFTDGSCYWQAQPSLRLAAWSAVIALPFSATWRFGVHGLLGASFLPGVIQSAYRAELYALGFVLHWASVSRTPVRIWSDCLGVVNRALLLICGKRRVRPNTVNSDLWFWVMQSAHELGEENIQIFKVPAHQEVRRATSLKQAWLIWNNGAADRAARMANSNRPAYCWELWGRYASEFLWAQNIHAEVVALHLAVADLSVRSSDHEPLEPVTGPRRSHRIFQKSYDDTAWNGEFLPVLAQRYNSSLANKVTTWWRTRVVTGSAVTSWIPLVFLYVDFQLTFGCAGPMKIQRNWVEPCQRPYLIPEKYKHSQRLRWFRTFLSFFWKTAGIKLGSATCRPDTEVIQAFVPAFSVAWDPWCLTLVEQWIRTHLVKPCARAALELRHLPLARPNTAMAIQISPNRGE